MTVTEGTLDVGDTGKKLDTTVVEQTDGTEAHREVVVVADPETLGAYAKVGRRPRDNKYGLDTFQPADEATLQHQSRVEELLEEIILRLESL